MQQTELHAPGAVAARPAPQHAPGPQLLDARLLALVGGGTGEPPPLPKEDSPKGGW